MTLYLKHLFIPHHGNEYRPLVLRHRALHWYTGILIALKVGAVLWISLLYPTPAVFSSVTAQNIITLTNEERARAGAKELRENYLLDAAARAKLADMLSSGYFAHISPAGVKPWKWILDQKYEYTYAGENLAMNFFSSEELVKAWMDSPSHRKNLLLSKYEDIGVAVGNGEINGQRVTLVVQMFGKTYVPGLGIAMIKGAVDPEVTTGPGDGPREISGGFGVVAFVPTKPSFLRFILSAQAFRMFAFFLIAALVIHLIVRKRVHHTRMIVHAIAVIIVLLLLIFVQFHFLEGVSGPMRI